MPSGVQLIESTNKSSDQLYRPLNYYHQCQKRVSLCDQQSIIIIIIIITEGWVIQTLSSTSVPIVTVTPKQVMRVTVQFLKRLTRWNSDYVLPLISIKVKAEQRLVSISDKIGSDSFSKIALKYNIIYFDVS